MHSRASMPSPLVALWCGAHLRLLVHPGVCTPLYCCAVLPMHGGRMQINAWQCFLDQPAIQFSRATHLVSQGVESRKGQHSFPSCACGCVLLLISLALAGRGSVYELLRIPVQISNGQRKKFEKKHSIVFAT